MAPPRRHLPKGTALAKLEGRIFFAKTDRKFEHYMLKTTLVIGRSDINQIPGGDLLKPAAGDQCDLGVGDSSKLSRRHAEIFLPPNADKFAIKCTGKNGLNVALPPYKAVTSLTPKSPPFTLETRTLIQLGECIFCFMLPCSSSGDNPNATVGANGSNASINGRKWTKAEQNTLRTLLLRFGYGRWDYIVKNAKGRLVERSLASIKEEVRTFLAFCYIHADGSEKKPMLELLTLCVADEGDGDDKEALEEQVNSVVDKVNYSKSDDEKMKVAKKYKRWARKLRILVRLGNAYHHPSLQKIRTGELELRFSPPESCWTRQDDYDLTVGTFKHGLGHNEAIRSDPELGFHDRYRPQPASRRGKVFGKAKEGNVKSSDEDIDDDDANDMQVELESNDDVRPLKEKNDFNAIMNSYSGGDLKTLAGKSKTSAPSKKETVLGGSANGANGVAKIEGQENGVNGGNETTTGNAGASAEIEDKTKDHGAEQNGNIQGDDRVLFPGADALMKRLKHIMNLCNKEHDRDMKEKRKKQESHARAEQRKVNAEARRRAKAEEKKKHLEQKRLTRTQPFSKKDATEFEKALANHGAHTNESGHIKWDEFHKNVPALAHKFPNTLENALEEFKKEACRLTDFEHAKQIEDQERMDELNMGDVKSEIFTNLTADRAKKVLNRLALFETLRDEMLPNPHLKDLIRSLKRTKEMPMWYRGTSYDIALLEAASLYGMNQWDKVAADTRWPFKEAMEEHARKYANQDVPLKKGHFPKSTIAQKRVTTLVTVFREKVANPYYQDAAGIKGEETRAATTEGCAREEGDEDVHHHQDHQQSQQHQQRQREPHEYYQHHHRQPYEQYALQQQQQAAVQGHGHSNTNGILTTETDTKTEVEASPQPEQLEEQPEPLNLLDGQGNLILPAMISNDLFLLELGEVVEGPDWHSTDVIYPLGYRSVRTIDAEAFLCEIRRMHDGPMYSPPLFRVSRLLGFQTRDYDKPMWADSRSIAEEGNLGELAVRGNVNMNTVTRWVDQFGLRNLTIRHYIEQMASKIGMGIVGGYEARESRIHYTMTMTGMERNRGEEDMQLETGGTNGGLLQYHQQYQQQQVPPHQHEQQQAPPQNTHHQSLAKRSNAEMNVGTGMEEYARTKRQKGDDPNWAR